MQEVNYYEKARKAIGFIEANLKQDVNVENIASETAYSRFHFTRKFLELTGQTPGAYLRKRRLEEAAKEILEGKDILTVALDFQFGSHQAFTRSFKSYFGTTPRLYREYRTSPLEEGKQNMKKELANLRWRGKMVSHLGCIKGCFAYLNLDISDGWLYGATGHAFLLNMGVGV
jgi:AraC family transcriptional regulator